MWVYSSTQATSAEATSRSSTNSSSRATTTFNAEHNTAGSASATAAATDAVTEWSTRIENSYITLETYRSSNSGSGTNSFTQPGTSGTGSNSDSASYESQRSLGFTRSTSGTTIVDSAGGTTTSSSELTTTRSRDSYASTTTTETVASNSQVTTTLTSTRQITTSAAPATTTSTTQVFTNTTSTNAAVTITRTTYAYAPSAMLTAPESLVPITEAEPTEQLWAATGSDSAGYPSNVATSFTKRTGTLATTSFAAPVAASTSFTSTQTRITGVGTTLTLTTTNTTSAVDTYCPAAGVYPATATSTRSFAMLTTNTTTLTALTTATATSSFNNPASCYGIATTTHRAFFSSLVPVTINASPTSTSATSFHMTWYSSTTTPLLLATAQNFAVSASGSASGNSLVTYTTTGTDSYSGTTETTTSFTSDTTTNEDVTLTFTTGITITTTTTYNLGPGTTVSETNTSATTSTSESGSTTFFASGTYTTTEGGFINSVYTNETESTYLSSTGFSSGWTSGSTALAGDGTRTIYSTTSASNATTLSTVYRSSGSYETIFNFGGSTITSSTEITFSEVVSATESGTESYTEIATSTIDTTTTDTDTTTVATTQTATTTFSYGETTTATTSFSDGVTVTYPGTQSSSSQSSFVEGSSLTHPFLHSQSTFTGSTNWTAHAFHPRNGFRHPLSLAATDPLYSVLSASPSIYYPPQATQDDSAGAITPVLYTGGTYYVNGVSTYSAQFEMSDSRLHYTLQTVGSTSTTGTVSFAGSSAASWFSHASTTNTTSGASRIGGVAAKSEYKAAVYMPLGVLRWTRQTDGTTSASNTTWTQTPLATDGSNIGFALPNRSESVWSVTTQSTRWSYNTQFSVGSATGDTSTPVMSLSLNPNI